MARRAGKETLPQQCANIIERSFPVALVMNAGCGRLCAAGEFIYYPNRETAVVGGHAVNV